MCFSNKCPSSRISLVAFDGRDRSTALVGLLVSVVCAGRHAYYRLISVVVERFSRQLIAADSRPCANCGCSIVRRFDSPKSTLLTVGLLNLRTIEPSD